MKLNRMSKWAKIGLAVLAFAVLYLLSTSFKVNDLRQKAIIIGLGIDYTQETQFTVTAEIITASAGDQPIGSRLLEGNGENVSKAMQEIYKKTGLTPSLSQCSIIILGRDLSRTIDVNRMLSYFTLSDAFKDSVSVAISHEDAKSIFEVQTPTETFVAFALHTILQQSSEKTNTPSNDLQHFVEKQLTPSQCSYLSIVTFLPNETESNKNDPTNEKEGGLFMVDKIALYRKGFWVGELTSEQTRGFNFIHESKSFETFKLEEKDYKGMYGDHATVAILDKKVGLECKLENGLPSLEIGFKIKLKEMRTDFSGYLSKMSPKTNSEINNDMKLEVQGIITELVSAAVNASARQDCDFLEISNSFYRKFGQKWKEKMKDYPNVAKDIPIKIRVEIL